jgi:dTMP kinase
MAADRAQHVDTVIAPALSRGEIVVTDRYSASTLAYQGFGRGLRRADLEAVLTFATLGLTPDLTIVVDCDLDTAKQRSSGTKADRLEQLDPTFHAAVRRGFLELAAGDPSFVVINGNATLAEVDRSVNEALATRLGLTVSSS